MGIENEYGISSAKSTDPITLSNRLVIAYTKHIYPDLNIRWDYDLENPLRDARGFDFSRADVDASLITNEDFSIPNIVLHNGARFYVDHAHPEYSSPEVLGPRDVVCWDLAGESIMRKAQELDAIENPDDVIRIFKNNADNKGASYGTHENYMTPRKINFNKLVAGLTPHFVTRQIYCGSGRVGLGQNSEKNGFQISQRADYIETHVGLETTMRRPIINTRDEPHSDPKLNRRLHVIIGDANMSDYATLLKFGTTSLILKMLEEEFIDPSEIELLNPVSVLKEISYDIKLENLYLTNTGIKISALEVQEWYLSKAKAYVDLMGKEDETDEVMSMWEFVLEKLKSDIYSLSNKIDWISKLSILDKYMAKNNVDFADPLIKSLDIKYSEIGGSDGIAQILRKNGVLESIYNQIEIDLATTNPPIDTRAWFRGRALSKFPKEISAASWDSLIFDIDRKEPLVRIPTPNPLRGTQKEIEYTLENSQNAKELVDSIRKNIDLN